jgi:glycosyltransferase involved in cell wall biosynthesis
VAGSQANLLHTSSQLANKDWEIFVYTTKDRPYQSNVLADYEEYKKIKISRRNSFSFLFLPFSLGLNYQSDGIICFNDFTTFPDIFVCFYTLLLKKLGLKKYKLVFSAMGLFNYSTEIYPSFKFKLKQLLDHTLGVYLINRTVDAIQAISETEKSGLIRAGIKPSLITLISCGIEEEALLDNIDSLASSKIKEIVKDTEAYILQVGRIDKIKNFETAIRSLKLTNENIKFFMVGQSHDAIYKDELIRIIKELEVGDRVVFLGEVSVYDKYYLMKKALALVHMSKWEGFGIVILEAMSQGAVCLISKGTAMDELIKEDINGYLFNFDDYESLGKKIQEIYVAQGSEKILKIKSNNTAIAKSRTWESISNQLDHFYKSVLESR